MFGAVLGAGAGGGLVLGGLLSEYLSWRAVLYVNTPIALVAILGAARVLTGSRRRERTPIDVPGAVLITAGLVGVVYGLATAAWHGWATPPTLGALAGGLVLLAVFMLIETRVPHPLLRPRILADRSRGGTYLTFALVAVALFGMFLLVSFYLQTVAGYTPLQTGLAFLPFAAADLATSSLAGRAMTRLRPSSLLAGGLALAAAGLGWLTQLSPASGYAAHVLPALVLIGGGLGLIGPVVATLATTGVAEAESGIASAVLNVSEQVGASVGAALLNTLAATGTASFLASHPTGPATRTIGLVHGYTMATCAGAVLLAVGAIVVLVLVKSNPDTTKRS